MNLSETDTRLQLRGIIHTNCKVHIRYTKSLEFQRFLYHVSRPPIDANDSMQLLNRWNGISVFAEHSITKVIGGNN